jgi:hypothetical protein
VDGAKYNATGMLLLRWGCLALAGILGLAAPAPASAHIKAGTLSTDFQARVGTLVPAVQGIEARVRDGDLLLELRVAPARVVVVLGLIGEPFLRFSRAGVEANLASPTAGSARVIAAADAVALPGVHWRLIRRGHVLAWHDNRLRPVADVRVRSRSPHMVASWAVPLVVDGRATTLSGTEWYAAAPSPWPWIMTGTLVLVLALVAGRRVSRGVQRLLAGALLVLALAGLMASWSGVILADRATPEGELFAAAFAGVSATFLFAGIAAARGIRQLGLMALVGAFAASFALPLIVVFQHGFVLSALPGTAARITAATAVVCGLSAAAVCAPAVSTLLSSHAAPGRAPRQLMGNE